jgi:adenosylcobinamide-phosphate guanylyltransferase
MCGGRASRIQHICMEKPLLKVDGVEMVERVISALAKSNRFSRIVTAVSPNAPETNEFLKSKKGIEIIETAGEGYSQDLSHLLLKLKPHKIITIPCDIPLLNPRIVNEIVDITASMQEHDPVVSIMLEKGFVEEIGVKPSIVLDQYCHSGITLFNTMAVVDYHEPVQERCLVMNRREIAINVNTKEELELAEKLLIQRL